MALPAKLKNMNMFINGITFVHQVPEVTRPKITRKLEEYRAGGMDAPVKIDLGQEVMEMDVKFGGYVASVRASMANPAMAGEQIRWMGAYQSDDTAQVDAVEIVVRGRWGEMDPGAAKPGDDTEETHKFYPVYYRESVNSITVIEIDVMNMICNIGGVDRLKQIRAAIGIGAGPAITVGVSL